MRQAKQHHRETQARQQFEDSLKPLRDAIEHTTNAWQRWTEQVARRRETARGVPLAGDPDADDHEYLAARQLGPRHWTHEATRWCDAAEQALAAEATRHETTREHPTSAVPSR